MAAISVFDIIKIGIGPSSSHTMGPWRAAQAFVHELKLRMCFEQVVGLRIELFGSLAKTGRGHGTDVALIMGLLGEDPVTMDPDQIFVRLATVRAQQALLLDGERLIPFVEPEHLRFCMTESLPFHPNGLRIGAQLEGGGTLEKTYFSVGGGVYCGRGGTIAGR